MFQNCSSLTSVVIPNGVTNIEPGAFYLCTKLTNATIPASVNEIWNEAFEKSNLTDVYYGGSENQWKQIHITTDNAMLTKATIHYNSTGTGTTPTPADPPTIPTFTDTPAWCAKEAQWAVQEGITNGAGSDTLFAPATQCTHDQILTFLWRAEGKPAAAQAPVTAASYYQDAVNWAYEKGFIDDSFQPTAPCTRAQAVSYIWQARNKPQAAKTASFTDIAADAPYAAAVNWAVEKEVTNGYGSADTFAPDHPCGRGEIVVFLYRAYN